MKRPLLAIGLASLVVGAWLGLFRAGVAVPIAGASVIAHGPLLVNGFFGTLIGIERAVALDEKWAFGAPALTAASALAAVLGAPAFAPLLATLGAALFLAASIRVVTKQVAAFTLTLAAGAAALFAGDALWLAGHAVPDVVLSWAAFFVLTIGGERLELGRVLRPSRASVIAFAACAGATFVSAIAAAFVPLAARAFGLSCLALSTWLVRHDVARRTVRTRGLPRFAATAMIGGYTWLAIFGALISTLGLFGRPLAYDGALHALFLGFVMSMVFGHAPIVLPAVTGITMPYRPIAYGPLVFLHASVLLRVGADLAGSFEVRRVAVVANALALLAFLVLTLTSLVRAPRPRIAQLSGR